MHSIGIGSKTSTGGAVIEGNGGVIFDGLVASSVGHKATCPACKKGIGPIVAVGPRTAFLPAGPAARAGDYVACGCPPGANVLVAPGTISIGGHSAGTAFRASQVIPGDSLPSGISINKYRNKSPRLVDRALPISEFAFPEEPHLAVSEGFGTTADGRKNFGPPTQEASNEHNWRRIGALDGGGGRVEKRLVRDAGQEIKLEAYSDTMGLEGFYVHVTPRPLDEFGKLASTADALKVVVPPVAGFDGIYRVANELTMKRSLTAGFGTGMSSEFHAPYENKNGFSWLILIPPQEQLHQNSAGYRVVIYGR